MTITTNRLLISNGGQISAGTAGSGDGGSVTIAAGSVVLDGTGATLPTGIVATTDYPAGGNGGSISLTVGSLQILGGAEINAATLGTGASGDISVSGGSVLVSGARSIITAQTLAALGGDGGNLRFNVNSVSVIDGGQISASTQGAGRGGSIDITANQVTLDGGGSIRAETLGTNKTVTADPSVQSLTVTLDIQYDTDSDLGFTLFSPSGNSVVLFNPGDANGMDFTGTILSDSGAAPIAGGVAPYAGIFQPTVPLALLGGGTANGTWQLAVSDFGAGSGTLLGWSVAVNGRQFASSSVPQPINPDSAFFNVPLTVALPAIQTQVKAGGGGDIQIHAGTVSVSNGGTITASTHGDGAAGSLNIHANSVHIDATHATSDTGFFVSTLPGSTGRGGSISIFTKEFQALGSAHSGISGGVVARSATNAPAGNITVQSDEVTLDAHAVISSANLGSGPAGSVHVTASDSIVMDGGSVITVVAQESNAGMIALQAGHNVELHDGSTVTASAGAGGGSIVITAGDEFYLDHSSIVATAGTGAGGNITIDPLFIILDHGLISANAAAGAGGNILIEGQYFFDNGSPITATGSTAGSVQISTLPLDLVNALGTLPGEFIDLSTALQESCTMRLGMDASSFLVLGRGGLEDSPEDPQEEMTARLRQKAQGKARGR